MLTFSAYISLPDTPGAFMIAPVDATPDAAGEAIKRLVERDKKHVFGVSFACIRISESGRC